MDLKEKIVSSYLAFEDHLDDNSPLHDIRNQAIKTFEEKGFPTKKEEAWKYTSLKSVLSQDYSVFPKQENALEYRDVKKYFIHDIDSYKIVFIDDRIVNRFQVTLASEIIRIKTRTGHQIPGNRTGFDHGNDL
jgi:Fe-S cluster assembly protein SufD